MTFFQTLDSWVATGAGLAWNWPVVILCLGGGLFFTFRFGLIQFRGFFHALKVLTGRYDNPGEPGSISHMQALTTAISATVGLGNIAGVAVAIKMGGPGAVFWMWVIGLLGMATKFTECSIASHFREKMPDGELRGGPMYYITKGLGKKFNWLAVFFSLACMASSFGMANMFQSHQAAEALHSNFGIPTWISGLLLAFFLGLVILGGIKRIGQVTSFLVPFMCLTYVMGALLVCLINLPEIPSVFSLILKEAFNFDSAVGGGLGSVIIWGVRRAIFSSESGLGSAPIAHAAAKTELGVRQGIVALLEPFIDTIVICSATAMVILLSGLHSTTDATGVLLTAAAFDHFLHGFGSYFVTVAVTLFAFSTAISWSYYGEVSASFLWGPKAALGYKAVFVLCFFLGSVWKLGPVLNFSDMMNGLMVVPNMLALFLLSNKIKRLSDAYFEKLRAGEFSFQRDRVKNTVNNNVANSQPTPLATMAPQE